MVLSPGGREAPTALQLSLQLQHVDGRCPGSATVPASECPKNGLSEPLYEAHKAPPPKTVDMVRPPGGSEAPTALQRSLQAASMSKDTAIGSIVPASADACVASQNLCVGMI